MKNRNNILVFMLTLVMLFGCTNESLDVPTIGKLDENAYYSTDEEAFRGVIAIYDVLQYHYNQWDWSSPLISLVILSDDAYAGGGGAGDLPHYHQLNEFTFTAANNAIHACYGIPYMKISRANKVIEKIDANNKIRKQIVAEAKILRAHAYFELVTLFGEVPLITRSLTQSELSQPRAAVADVYAQIEKDLTEALVDIPHVAEYPATDKFRVSWGTAQALLGKVYLYQQKYQLAATTLKKLIDSNEYDLVSKDEYASLFLKEKEFCKESIFEVQYTMEKGYDWGTFPWGERQAESNAHTILCGPREGYFKWGNSGLKEGWGFAGPTKSIYNAFDEPNDVRRRASVVSFDELVAEGGGWNDDANADHNVPFGYEGYFRIKYSTIEGETTTEGVTEMNYGTNWRLIRYADVLLMAAEAYNKVNQDDAARTELNKVRNRAGLSNTTASGDKLFEVIVKERRKELCFEGSRFMDLVRWGKAAEVLGPLGFKAKHNLLPIPLDEMLNNSAITKNNDGY